MGKQLEDGRSMFRVLLSHGNEEGFELVAVKFFRMFLHVTGPELVCFVVHYAAVPRVELRCFDPRRMGRPHGEQNGRGGENVGSGASVVSLLM